MLKIESETSIKNVSIINPTETSNVIKSKEKKMRVETHTWNIDDMELSFETQLQILNKIHNNILKNNNSNKNEINKECVENDSNKNKINKKYINTFINNIKHKISSYKQQDIIKKILDTNNFTTFNNVIFLLYECELKCIYCHKEIFILYKEVREMSQWTLDRINNDLGHNIGNLVISCLKCNLKRRRINKNAFLLTKNLIINKQNYTNENIDESQKELNDSFKFEETSIKKICIKSDINSNLNANSNATLNTNSYTFFNNI